MVQKYQSAIRVYKYPFELMMAAYEMRFPTCDMIPVVKETEIIEETLSEDESLHVIDRRAKLVLDIPYLLKKIAGIDHLLFRQRNSLCKNSRTLKIDAWNESFATRVIINELCIYSVHPDNPEWTCFEQSAELDIKSLFGFESTAEKIAINEYSKNIAKTKDIMEYHIGVLAERGVCHIPIWTPPQNIEIKKELERKDKSLSEEISNLQVVSGDDSQQPLLMSTDLPSPDIVSSSIGATANRASFKNSRGSRPGSQKQQSTPEQQHRKSITASHSNTPYHLEQSYIQTYLGDLTPIQESCLVQLKMRVAELMKSSSSRSGFQKLPSDAVCLRFLRAREFNVEKAREMLFQSLVWRKKNAVDKILSEYEYPDVIQKYFPGAWHFHDRQKRPMFILRLGLMDVKGILRSVGFEGLTKLTLHICEEGLRLTEEASFQSEQPISTWSLVLDLEGLNMRHLWRPGMKALLHIIEICEANYPETLGQLLIVRAPRVFPILWTLVHPFIDETSRSKFFLYSGPDDYAKPEGGGGLVDYVAREHIPHWLSGTCPTGPHDPKINEGGIVPKSFYMPIDLFEKDQSPGAQSNLDGGKDHGYHSMSLTKGQCYEGLMQVKEKGCVITWDFDILRNDVMFTLYRIEPRVVATIQNEIDVRASAAGMNLNDNAHNPPSNDSPTSDTGGEGTKRSTSTPTPAHAPSAAPVHSIIESGWKEGVDYHKVEGGGLVCREGESIQGSHVTSNLGLYILQWRFHGDISSDHQGSSSSSHHASSALDDVLDTFTHHQKKSKVMYFYEVLSAENYKGSMYSLQSQGGGSTSRTTSLREGESSCTD